jgi:DNA processing protein
VKDPEELLYAIALSLVPQVGAVQGRVLLETLGSARAIFKTPISTLEKIPGIGRIRAGNIRSFSGFERAESELRFIEKFNVQPLVFNMPGYPRRLLHCEDPPFILFYKGNANLDEQKVISIVGTRKPSEYGQSLVRRYMDEWKNEGILVISGLAYGIDQFAHRAALDNGLKTIGVLANGLDTIYPASHTSLARDMVQRGGLLTEFISGTKPDKQNFPRRNRIVAGLCDALWVVETDVKGGSMITADIAAGYNREVFASPGRTMDRKSAGCNLMVRENKARVTLEPSDIPEFLNWEPASTAVKQAQLFVQLGEDEQKIITLLHNRGSLRIDDLLQASGLSRSACHSALLTLELEGLLMRSPGNMLSLRG